MKSAFRCVVALALAGWLPPGLLGHAEAPGEPSKLRWQSSGVADAFGGIAPWPLELTETVPHGLRSRPAGLVAPRYGVIELGPAGRGVSIVVILDAPEGTPGTLYVNRKADGEMVTDAGRPMTLKTGTYPDGSAWTRYATEVSVEIPSAEGIREANLVFLRVDPKRSPALFESYLVLAADFGSKGTTVVNGRPVPTIVQDAGCRGEVNPTDDRLPRPRCWFDLDGDGHRDAGEVVEGSESFLCDGQWWAVASLGNDGTIRIESPESPEGARGKKILSAEQARAIEDHLAAHPDSRHFRVGLEQLFMHYRDEVQDKERALATLERLHEHLIARADPEELKEGLRFEFLASVGMEAEDRALVALEREHAFLVQEEPRDFAALGENLGDWVYRLTKSNQAADAAKARELITRARGEFAGDPDAERFSKLLARCEGLCNRPAVGGTLEIAFTPLDGSRVDLADMKGKVVLVDFWATWCAPCVASQPAIKSAYERYHAKGFEVIGISLDDADSKDSVVRFLADNDLPWPQSFDGKGWETPLAVTCGITAIPATFLLGKDGRIDSINVHGEELEARLARLLGDDLQGSPPAGSPVPLIRAK